MADVSCNALRRGNCAWIALHCSSSAASSALPNNGSTDGSCTKPIADIWLSRSPALYCSTSGKSSKCWSLISAASKRTCPLDTGHFGGASRPKRTASATALHTSSTVSDARHFFSAVTACASFSPKPKFSGNFATASDASRQALTLATSRGPSGSNHPLGVGPKPAASTEARTSPSKRRNPSQKSFCCVTASHRFCSSLISSSLTPAIVARSMRAPIADGSNEWWRTEICRSRSGRAVALTSISFFSWAYHRSAVTKRFGPSGSTHASGAASPASFTRAMRSPTSSKLIMLTQLRNSSKRGSSRWMVSIRSFKRSTASPVLFKIRHWFSNPCISKTSCDV
mmetsp:Transcript_119963/g.339459  ORF Transcript_119963/g.339459 Transcript_119963/m.339459 type:complete len:340 (+) Transcript_119963:1680-2699(+)